MLRIKIPKGVEKLEIPMGIYVNGFIIKATPYQSTKSMLELNNRVDTHIHTDHKGD
jgi:hypothetical protein